MNTKLEQAEAIITKVEQMRKWQVDKFYNLKKKTRQAQNSTKITFKN